MVSTDVRAIEDRLYIKKRILPNENGRRSNCSSSGSAELFNMLDASSFFCKSNLLMKVKISLYLTPHLDVSNVYESHSVFVRSYFTGCVADNI